MDFVAAKDFFASLASDERVFLLIRHGERNHITPNDPDYGAHVGLTERGREQAFSLGRSIPDGDMVFFSSPVGRCMETARCIGEGHGLREVHVEPLGCLGDFFVQDQGEFEKVLRAGFYEGICEWLESEASGVPRTGAGAFYPLASRSEEMLSMMLEKGCARFNIFATHDAWVVPCLTHFCKMRFTPQRWMNYLTGMAVVTGPEGKTPRRIVPVTGLETGWLEF
jgi:hypothetical protein